MIVASCHPEKQWYVASLTGLGLSLTSLRDSLHVAGGSFPAVTCG